MRWLEERVAQYRRKGLTAENMAQFETLENFMGAGIMRALYCLCVAPMRYLELEAVSGVPRATLMKALKKLIRTGFVEQERRFDKIYRNEKVTFYKLTRLGKRFNEVMAGSIEIGNMIKQITGKKV